MAPEPNAMGRLVEALLFVAEGPVATSDLARAAQASVEDVEEAVRRLTEALSCRGLRVARSDGRLQMVAAPEASEAIERFLGMDLSVKLSAAALETLSIVAYRQPVTRSTVDAIRGVNSDAVLRALHAKGLIEPTGRLEQAGRPILWGTTFDFLQYFGVCSLGELPDLPRLEDDPTTPDEGGAPSRTV